MRNEPLTPAEALAMAKVAQTMLDDAANILLDIARSGIWLNNASNRDWPRLPRDVKDAANSCRKLADIAAYTPNWNGGLISKLASLVRLNE